MTPRIEDRQLSKTERQVTFSTGISASSGARRYLAVTVYVYTHKGEQPSVLIQTVYDLYTAASARKVAALLIAAADWIDANVSRARVR